MTAILEIEGLTHRFGGFVAVADVNLSVARGRIHAIIGPNGAGKTTLFNTLTGRLVPTEGRIVLEGQDITRVPPHARVKRGLGRSYQVTNLFQNLSVLENLRLAAQGPQAARALTFWRPVTSFRGAVETAHKVAERLGLDDRLQSPAYQLPHGQQRRLEIGLAMAARPKLLLLDEPTSGMGVDDIDQMRDLVVDLARDHTVLLIEHNMEIVMSISDVITVMAQGEVLVEGPPETVQADSRVRRAYLGEDA